MYSATRSRSALPGPALPGRVDGHMGPTACYFFTIVRIKNAQGRIGKVAR